MLKQTLLGEIDGYRMVKRYLTKRNTIIWCKLTVASVTNEKGDIMHYVSHIQPLLNGEKAKMEMIGDKKIRIRPTISMGDFISDNYKWFIGAGFTTVCMFVGLGIAVWGTLDKIERWEKLIKESETVEIRLQQ